MPRLNHSIRAISFICRRCGVLCRTGLCGRCADRAWIRDREESLWSLSRRSAKRERAPILNRRPSATCRAGIRSADLEEALAEGIIVGHEGVEMPHFQFSPPMIAALMAYMDAVQAK